MRVWIVNHHATPPSEPGGTRHHSLARELVRRSHDVTVLSSSFNHATGKQISGTKGHLSTRAEFDGVSFLILLTPGYRGRIARFWNMLVFALQVWCRIGTRGMRKPDVVVGSSLTLFAALSAARLARHFGVPFVLEIRDLWPQTLIDMGMGPYHPAVLVFGVIERYLYGNADEIVTLLPNAAEYISSRGAGGTEITWIPNGVDVHSIPFLPPTPHEVFTVVYAGSHGLSDALDPVLDAAIILQKRAPGRFRFRFIGDGPCKDGLRHRVQTDHIVNVVFEDPVPKLKIIPKLLEADAFIIAMKKTDLYRYGISPNKLHDYMAAGRPTVVAGTVHNNPVADAAAGITVPPEDPHAMAEAVETLADMSLEDRRSMGLRARKYIEHHHDFAVLAQRLEGVLTRAVGSHTGVHGACMNMRTSEAIER